ncbi:hypothetical protein FHG87_003456 [Trinorchestia longiramus]|nr:hypothetical protein FHG87_003456 [Trinorchestia longiramus]
MLCEVPRHSNVRVSSARLAKPATKAKNTSRPRPFSAPTPKTDTAKASDTSRQDLEPQFLGLRIDGQSIRRQSLNARVLSCRLLNGVRTGKASLPRCSTTAFRPRRIQITSRPLRAPGSVNCRGSIASARQETTTLTYRQPELRSVRISDHCDTQVTYHEDKSIEYEDQMQLNERLRNCKPLPHETTELYAGEDEEIFSRKNSGWGKSYEASTRETESNDGSDVSQISLGAKIKLIAMQQRENIECKLELCNNVDELKSKLSFSSDTGYFQASHCSDERGFSSVEERETSASQVSEEVPEIIISEKTNFQFKNEGWKHLLQRNNELLSKLSGTDFSFLAREMPVNPSGKTEILALLCSEESLTPCASDTDVTASSKKSNDINPNHQYMPFNSIGSENNPYFLRTSKPERPLTPISSDCVLEDISEETSQADLDSLSCDSKILTKVSQFKNAREIREYPPSNGKPWQKQSSSIDEADNRDTSVSERSLSCTSDSKDAKNSSQSPCDTSNNSTEADTWNSVDGNWNNFVDKKSVGANLRSIENSNARNDLHNSSQDGNGVNEVNAKFYRADCGKKFAALSSESLSESTDLSKGKDIAAGVQKPSDIGTSETRASERHDCFTAGASKATEDIRISACDSKTKQDSDSNSGSGILTSHSPPEDQKKLSKAPTRSQFLSQKNAIEKLVLEKVLKRKEWQEAAQKASSGTQTTSSDSGLSKNNETEDPVLENESTDHKKSSEALAKTAPGSPKERESLPLILHALVQKVLSIKSSDADDKKALAEEKVKLEELHDHCLRLCRSSGWLPRAPDWPELHSPCRKELADLRIKLLDDKKALADELQEVKKQLADIAVEHNRKMKAMSAQHQVELEACKHKIQAAEHSRREKWAMHKTKLIKESSFRGLETRIKDLMATHRDEISKLKAKHWQEMRAVEEKALAEQRQRDKTALEGFEVQKEEACRREMERSQQRLELELQRCEQMAAEKALAMSKSHSAEMQEQKERYERELSSLICEHRAHSAQLLSEIERTKRNMENALAQVTKEHQTELNAGMAERTTNERRLREELTRDAALELEAQAKRLAEKFKRQRDRDIERALQQLQQEVQREWQQRLQEVEQKHRYCNNI